MSEEARPTRGRGLGIQGPPEKSQKGMLAWLLLPPGTMSWEAGLGHGHKRGPLGHTWAAYALSLHFLCPLSPAQVLTSETN